MTNAVYLIWYFDNKGNGGCAYMHGPTWQKAWQTTVTTTYLKDPASMPVLLLLVEKVTGDVRERLYESPYMHLLETDHNVKEFYERKVATATHSSVDGRAGHGS